MKRSGFTPKADWKPLQRKSTLKASKPMAKGSSTLKPVGARAKRTGQGRVKPTAEEQAWMDAAREFGCIVCWLQHGVRTPAVIHHIISGGRRMGHLFTIPLCEPGHHQQSPTPLKISRHPDKARFEESYGTETFLLETLRRLVAPQHSSNYALAAIQGIEKGHEML